MLSSAFGFDSHIHIDRQHILHAEGEVLHVVII
jgi:hypothetical protein